MKITLIIHSRPGVKLDERSAALIMMKCLPLGQLIQMLYPDMYKVDNLELAKTKEDEEGQLIPVPGRLQLSAEHVTLNGAFLMDCGDKMLLFLGKVLQPFFCEKVIVLYLPMKQHKTNVAQMFGVSKPLDVDENLTDLPELENEDSERYMGAKKVEPNKELFVAGCVLLSHI